MTRLTIGVPVYNGDAFLSDALECLRTQTFEDMEVLVGDNASTDGTADICADFAARDPRFRHIRRPENIGVLANFRDLRDRAMSELFCWRAHDDTSDRDFIEKLVGLFAFNPAIRLAVSRVKTVDDTRSRALVHRYPAPLAMPRMLRIIRQFHAVHASWIYGIWDRETLIRIQDDVHRTYHHLGGWDDLCLLPLILDEQIAGSNETTFTQRVFRAHLDPAKQQAMRPSVADMRLLREDFRAFAFREFEARDWGTLEHRLLSAALERYVDRRGYSRRKLRRRAARHGEDEATGATLDASLVTAPDWTGPIDPIPPSAD